VLAWRTTTGYGLPAATARLRALDPAATYADQDRGVRYHGAALLSEGLPLDLPGGDYASILIHLRRV
jgi:alpha-galactosidase